MISFFFFKTVQHDYDKANGQVPKRGQTRHGEPQSLKMLFTIIKHLSTGYICVTKVNFRTPILTSM